MEAVLYMSQIINIYEAQDIISIILSPHVSVVRHMIYYWSSYGINMIETDSPNHFYIDIFQFPRLTRQNVESIKDIHSIKPAV